MSTVWLRLVAVLTLAFALGACAGNGGAGSASAGDGELVDFPLGSFNGEIYVLDYVAVEQGFFEDHGLNVTFISPQQGGASANTLFVGGTLKGWPGNPAPIILNVTKGEDIKIAGMLDDWIPFQVVVREDSDLAQMRDASFEEKMEALRGKKIGLTAVESLVYQSLSAGLTSAGVPVDDVTILAVGQPDSGLGQLEAGRIDGYVTYSLTDTEILAQRANTVQFVSLTGEEAPEEIRSFSAYALPVMGSLVEENPEAVEGYVAAQQEAYDWTRENIEEAAQIVADRVYNGDYADVLTEALNELFSGEPHDFKVNPDTWENHVQLLVNQGVIPEDAADLAAYEKVVLPEAQVG